MDAVATTLRNCQAYIIFRPIFRPPPTVAPAVVSLNWTDVVAMSDGYDIRISPFISNEINAL